MFRRNLSVMFLGTSSGGGPSESRNCSSLICDFLDDYSLWLVDCAEGTIRQFQLQTQEGFHYRPNKVSKILVTHMHADHIMGIVPFLRNVLLPPEAGTIASHIAVRKPAKVEIYGPAGLRTFVRQIMKMTFTHTAENYAVHELLTRNDPITQCDLPESTDEASPSGFDHNIANQNIMHVSECPGSDIRADAQGFWRTIATGKGRIADLVVDAGPIQHRDPCLGYIFTEVSAPNRKIAILGDTHDPSEIVPLCINPSPSLLIHEATDAAIPAHADAEGKLSRRLPDEVLRKALLRGHSVPSMAGAFAKAVGANQLVLNHIGGRFPAPRNKKDPRCAILREIERQATEAWGSGKAAVAATDFLRIDVPPPGLSAGVFARTIQAEVTVEHAVLSAYASSSSWTHHQEHVSVVESIDVSSSNQPRALPGKPASSHPRPRYRAPQPNGNAARHERQPRQPRAPAAESSTGPASSGQHDAAGSVVADNNRDSVPRKRRRPARPNV